jgi:two-component system, NtrC family, sensor histidine kinase HydH
MGADGCDTPLVLAWNERLLLVEAQGALPAQAPPRPGRPLAEALGIQPELAQALDARARAGGGVEFLRVGGGPSGRWLRVSLSAQGELAQACVLDVGALLEQAPPVQISALSGSLSHELRNPLSSIKLAVQTLARNEDLSAKDQRRLTIAQREIRTLERMLSTLSEYGREDSVAVEAWPLPELVEQAVQLIEPDLRERGIRVQTHAPKGLGRVQADAERLRPVLGQLLLNVAAGLGEGEGLEVQLAPSAQGASLQLLDSAATLSPGEEQRIFEPFGSRLARGAGLSLAALRRVLQQQRGDVAATPAPGGGIVFTLHFAAA